MAENIKAGYVITTDGTILVQTPNQDSQWGFSLASDDQSWDGGFGIGEWELIEDDDKRITDDERENLGWILDEARNPTDAREYI